MQKGVIFMPKESGIEKKKNNMQTKIYKDDFISYKLPSVSIITPSIRTGWWNIMAHNISRQTYQGNIEWIIVDDHPDDRSEIAHKYSSLYNLEVRYLRGGKSSNYTRRCGLVRANNIAWENMKGELYVQLQDFCLMPQDGLERLVDIYRHHPNDLIAPVDVYYTPKPPNKDNSECWWGGDTHILVKKEWSNIRVKYEGMRYSDNPFDYEANY